MGNTLTQAFGAFFLSKEAFQIIVIRQKLPEQEPILITYFDSDDHRAALVGFRIWIEDQNGETILVKMVFDLGESVKK